MQRKFITKKNECLEEVCEYCDEVTLAGDIFVTGSGADEYVSNKLSNLDCSVCHKPLFIRNNKK
jgi:hypothetical protein